MADRQQLINHIWRRYLNICGNENHAKNAMKKALGKSNTEAFRSADFTEADIKTLLLDLAYRELDHSDAKPNSPEDLGFVKE